MIYILSYILLLLFFLAYAKKSNKLYYFLIALYSISFFLQFLVGRSCPYDTTKTFLNLLFIYCNMALVIIPWSNIKMKDVTINLSFVNNYKRWLYPILYVNYIVSIFVGVVVFLFMPDISNFKANDGYLELYETIPLFSIFFRIAFVIQIFGFLAIPLYFYYISLGDKKKARKALFLSLSTLVSAFAFYSRSLIFSFSISFLAYYFLIKGTLPVSFNARFNKILKKVAVVLIPLFLILTFVRFSAMDYYGDRIPANSYIKDPVLYSIVDYASMSHECGVYCLENYEPEKCLNGAYMFMNVNMILNFFGITHWEADTFKEKADLAFSGNYGLFNGYVASSVCDIGYCWTLIVSLLFSIISISILKRKRISLKSAACLLLLLQLPLNAIFYDYLNAMMFPFLFILGITLISKKSSYVLNKNMVVK